MDEDKGVSTTHWGFLLRLTGKLAVLLGSGLAILNGALALDAKVLQPEVPSGTNVEASGPVTRALPPKAPARKRSSSPRGRYHSRRPSRRSRQSRLRESGAASSTLPSATTGGEYFHCGSPQGRG